MPYIGRDKSIAKNYMERLKMPELGIYSETLRVSTETGLDIVNISPLLDAIVGGRRVDTGVLTAFVAGSTASLTTIEFEPGVVEDLASAISRLAPRGAIYEHEKAWRDGNGHSHVQAAFLGPSVSIPVRNGKLATGVWQQVVLINHDIKPRERLVEVTLIGI